MTLTKDEREVNGEREGERRSGCVTVCVSVCLCEEVKKMLV